MKKPREGELTLVGDMPLAAELKKQFPPLTTVQRRLIDAAVAIRQAPDAAEKAYMARQLVQCTLPHSDPGGAPVWVRRDGNAALVLQPGWNVGENRSYGYPYGVIPRLLLFWVITEAKQKGERRLILGRSLADFLRAVGFDPRMGGKDIKRLRDQMYRLFRCHITFQGTQERGTARGDAQREMPVAPEHELWWSRSHPEQTALWPSWIELGEKFFQAIMDSPAVPIDKRALKALKKSPLALDLYAWVCYQAFVVVTRRQPSKFVAWSMLMCQLGTEYDDIRNFKKKAWAALGKIRPLYPGLTIGKAKGGFRLHATRLAVPRPETESLTAGE
jgi:hypothetical protein